MDDHAYLTEDAKDRRAALQAAAGLLYRDPAAVEDGIWLHVADDAYRWLQRRDSLHAVAVQLVPGIPRAEGTTVATTFDLSDTDQVTFSLTGLDAKGASVPLADGFTAAWTLADPDASGATLTVSADTLTADVAAGVPDTNLLLSVVVTNPDASTLSGAEAIIVQATAAATVGLVAGAPVPE